MLRQPELPDPLILSSITLNTGLQRYGGDLYVGSMSILMSVMQMITIPVQGITQGIQPIISYNYGAGNKERVKATMKRMILVCLTGTLLLAGVAIFAPQVDLHRIFIMRMKFYAS